ncbi:putative DnaJ domain, Chaperone J-domain superfamily [Helianthus annuus]|nr:putative DnaJ domain, Chaperone J-domain superfamily [Helianthus annuus]
MLCFSFVYDDTWSLEGGETNEAQFIKIQASYELLIDSEKRSEYDMVNRVNPTKVLLITLFNIICGF